MENWAKSLVDGIIPVLIAAEKNKFLTFFLNYKCHYFC